MKTPKRYIPTKGMGAVALIVEGDFTDKFSPYIDVCLIEKESHNPKILRGLSKWLLKAADYIEYKKKKNK